MTEAATIRRSPSVPTLKAHDLNWLIDEYINWQRTQLDNQATVDCYACKLRWFQDWWEVVGPKQQWLLRQADLLLFERFLRVAVSKRTKRSLSWHTRNDVLRRLREMFHWACQKQHTERDYAEWIPKADGGAPKRRAAGVGSLMRLLAEAGNSPQAPRDRAIIAMMMGMGLRRIEIVNLNVEDVVIEADLSGYAHVIGKRTPASPDGKRDAVFDQATGKIVAAHLDAALYDHGPLFRTTKGTRMNAQAVYRATKRLIEAAGLHDQIQACHDLRRAFTTFSARTRRGIDAADRLRRQLGHAKYNQTADYVLYDVNDLRQGFVSPVGIMPHDLFYDFADDPSDALDDPAVE